MTAKPDKEVHDWSVCTWAGARRDVLDLGSKLSFREKIMWLEEGARLAGLFKSARSGARNSSKTEGSR